MNQSLIQLYTLQFSEHPLCGVLFLVGSIMVILGGLLNFLGHSFRTNWHGINLTILGVILTVPTVFLMDKSAIDDLTLPMTCTVIGVLIFLVFSVRIEKANKFRNGN